MPSLCLRRPQRWSDGRKYWLTIEKPVLGSIPQWSSGVSPGLLFMNAGLLTGRMSKCSFSECPELVTWELGFEGCLGVLPAGKQWGRPLSINEQSVLWQGLTGGPLQGQGLYGARSIYGLLNAVIVGLYPPCSGCSSLTNCLNLSLSPVPSARPGKTRDAWYMLAE